MTVNKAELEEIIREIVKDEIQKETEKISKISKIKNTFKRIEEMLRCYRTFKRRIKELEEEYENIVIKKQVNYDPIFACSYEHLSEIEKIELKKEQIKLKINKHKALADLIEFGLEEIKNDKYYKLIELRYFEKNKIEKVTEILGIGESTFRENRNRLVNKLCEIMYPDEILEQF